MDGALPPPRTAPAELEAEFVVVGSGAGGGPLACRLAEAGHTVLLIEAGGRDAPIDVEVPAFNGYAAEHPAIAWSYWVRHYDDPGRRRRDRKYRAERDGVLYPRAGTLGGCTMHNALITIAPHARDWDEIAAIADDASWGAGPMRRYFQRLERCGYRDAPETGSDPDGHGFHGWLSTERAPVWLVKSDQDLVIGLARTALGAFLDDPGDVLRRLREGVFDPNDAQVADGVEGLVRIPLATRGGRRNGPRERIQDTLARHPERLRVVTGALATRVVFEEGSSPPRAVGVELLLGERLYRADPSPSPDPGTPALARATREVILAAGAFNTPQLLQLSGIGDREDLERAGVPLLVELPGVGRNLQDRYEVGVVFELDEPFEILGDVALRPPAEGDPPDQTLERWRDGEGIYTSNGVVLGLIERSRPRLETPDLFIFGIPADFHGYYPGYADDLFAHRNRFTWAVLKAHTHNRAGAVRIRSADPREPPEVGFRYFEEGDDRARRDLDAVAHGVGVARRIMEGWPGVARELLPGVQDPDDLKQFIRDEAWGHHASCTCPIGRDDDQMAVLDGRLRVRGTAGLRVVDASAFPSIPGFFIVTAIYMLSERAADLIAADHRTAPA